jgi:NAD+ synthase (glutamine-hydrolysing)
MDKLGADCGNIHTISLPGLGTSERTKNNARMLAEILKTDYSSISIVDAVNKHFTDISHDPAEKNIVYENAQARERMQILMDIANQVDGLVVGTGDLSELALGWSTYNGDQMSMYGVNAGIPKTLVKYIIEWCAEEEYTGEASATLRDIINTPISPELLPTDEQGEITQLTEASIGPYEMHDFFLFYMFRFNFSPKKILFLAKTAFKDTYSEKDILHYLKVFYNRFFNNQFKRSCMPDGMRVGTVSLSPRGDWRMPSDACVALWLNEMDTL